MSPPLNNHIKFDLYDRRTRYRADVHVGLRAKITYVAMMGIVKATLVAGLIPGILVPVLWPLVVFLIEGKFPDGASYPMGAVAIAFFATLTGLVVSVGLGSLTLVCLEKYRLNNPILAAGAGFIVGVTVFWLAGPSLSQAPLGRSWPVYLFLGVLGAVCGSMASQLSRPSQRPKTTPYRRGLT